MSSLPPALANEPLPMPAPSVPAVPAERAPRILGRMLALDDFEPEAARVLPRPIFGYASGGS